MTANKRNGGGDLALRLREIQERDEVRRMLAGECAGGVMSMATAQVLGIDTATLIALMDVEKFRTPRRRGNRHE